MSETENKVRFAYTGGRETWVLYDGDIVIARGDARVDGRLVVPLDVLGKLTRTINELRAARGGF